MMRLTVSDKVVTRDTVATAYGSPQNCFTTTPESCQWWIAAARRI